MSKALPALPAATTLTGSEEYLVNQGGNPRRASDAQMQTRFAGGFTHTQGSAATVWTVNHNLGRRPIVAVFTVGGAEMDAEIIHVSNNQLTVNFASAQAGSARCL